MGDDVGISQKEESWNRLMSHPLMDTREQRWKNGISMIMNRKRSLVTVSGEGESVLPEPGGATRSSLGGGISMTFAQAARRFASGSLPAQFPMLLLGFADPLNAGISSDGGVSRIYHDDFVIFVGRVLANPVRVQDAQRTDFASDTLLSDRLERALELHLVDSVVSGLAIRATLGNGLLARTTADTHSVNDESLLSAVTQPARLLNASWLRCPVHARQLTVLPGAHT